MWFFFELVFFLQVRRCEENEELLRIKLEQITEEKEELEFKVLEHQECSEMVGEDGARGRQEHDAEILKKNEELESEVTQLQKKLEKYESAVKAPERHVGLQCDRLSENLPSVAPVKVAITKPDSLELSAESLLDDMENDSGIEAALSTSISSGFDETSSEAEETAFANDPHPPDESMVSGILCQLLDENLQVKSLLPGPSKSYIYFYIYFKIIIIFI